MTPSIPLLHPAALQDPSLLRRVELRRVERQLVLCVEDHGGARGVSFACSPHAELLVPLLQARILPAVLGKDLTNWEALLDGIYRHKSNYKMQGLALWLPVALLEMAVLDLLGKRAGLSIGALLGPRLRDELQVYEAFHDRSLPAEALADEIEARIQVSQARAVKFKLGGRMNGDLDCVPGRSERLPALLRQRLGADMHLYGDANGSYSVAEAIRIGHVLEESAVDFFEEPCPFDHFEETRQVAEALRIPIAGGEQDGSLYRLAWMLEHKALRVVQPDLFYCGGMLRSLKIARLAASLGATCAPHISGYGLGALYLAHFVSALPNAAPFHEYKGTMHIPGLSIPPELLSARDGALRIPDGPGIGFDIDPEWLARGETLCTCGP